MYTAGYRTLVSSVSGGRLMGSDSGDIQGII